MEGQHITFHLAALIAIPYSYVAPRSYFRVNIEGTLNVLEAARRLRTERVVHTSTSEVYGTALRTPIEEDHPLGGSPPTPPPRSARTRSSSHISDPLTRPW
jgi:nucleoside-diphosphate-sugar epimerase